MGGGGTPAPPTPFTLHPPPPPPFILYLNSSLLATFYTLSFIDYIYIHVVNMFFPVSKVSPLFSPVSKVSREFVFPYSGCI